MKIDSTCTSKEVSFSFLLGKLASQMWLLTKWVGSQLRPSRFLPTWTGRSFGSMQDFGRKFRSFNTETHWNVWSIWKLPTTSGGFIHRSHRWTAQVCIDCRGTGAREGTTWSKCRVCKGTGVHRQEILGILLCFTCCSKEYNVSQKVFWGGWCQDVVNLQSTKLSTRPGESLFQGQSRSVPRALTVSGFWVSYEG